MKKTKTKKPTEIRRKSTKGYKRTTTWNRRRTIRYKGRETTYRAIWREAVESKRTKVHFLCFWKRVVKHGWDISVALATPPLRVKYTPPKAGDVC